METSERRAAILKLLCRCRFETMKNLAKEFGVSERTVRRDIEVLSLHEPIYTKTGRYGGGVYVTENYSIDRMYFQSSQVEILRKLLFLAENRLKCELSDEEISSLRKLLADYTKPSAVNKKRNGVKK